MNSDQTHFIEDCLKGKATFEDIDQYIERWHSSNTTIPLCSYLGMTDDDYRRYVLNDSLLPTIIESYRRV